MNTGYTRGKPTVRVHPTLMSIGPPCPEEGHSALFKVKEDTLTCHDLARPCRIALRVESCDFNRLFSRRLMSSQCRSRRSVKTL